MSRQLAESLRDWLPSVLQFVKPYFTPTDIEKGARWGKDIAKELEEASVGIFCLTKENLTKPWIMFEAGALSKNLDAANVCPLLFNVDNADLQGPLVQFQASPFSQGEIRKLIGTLNNLAGDSRLADGVLTNVFNMWWPQLEERVKKIYAAFENQPAQPGSERTDRELLEEVLQLTRLRSKRMERPADLGALVYAIRRLAELPPGGSPAVAEMITSATDAIEFYVTRGEVSSEERSEVKKNVLTIHQTQKSGL